MTAAAYAARCFCKRELTFLAFHEIQPCFENNSIALSADGYGIYRCHYSDREIGERPDHITGEEHTCCGAETVCSYIDSVRRTAASRCAAVFSVYDIEYSLKSVMRPAYDGCKRKKRY